MGKVRFIVCANKNWRNTGYPGDCWQVLNCEYDYATRVISAEDANGTLLFAGNANTFHLYWDLPADAGIIGIMRQAEKGMF